MSFASTSNLKERKITSMREKPSFAIKCRIYKSERENLGFGTGDESEHLILPFFTFCCLHLRMVLVFGIMNSWVRRFGACSIAG